MGEEVTARLTMPDKKIYEIKVNQNITFKDVLVKLINKTKIMEHKNANDNLILVSNRLAFGPDKFKNSINQRVEKIDRVRIFKLEAFIFDVNHKDYFKVKDYFINLGNIKTQNEQGISKNMIQDPNSIKNFQHVEQQDNKKKLNMIEDIKVSEKINLKINDFDGNLFCQISIGINSTVYDLIGEIIKRNEAQINEKGVKYLALTYKNGENLVITDNNCLNSSLKDLKISDLSEIVISLSQQPVKNIENGCVKIDNIKSLIKQQEKETQEEKEEIKIQVEKDKIVGQEKENNADDNKKNKIDNTEQNPKQNEIIDESEEIEIHLKGIGNSENKSHSIKINPKCTVSDLTNKIKLDKNIVGNNKYLYLAPGNHDNILLSEKKSMNLKISDFGIQNGSKLDFDFFDSDSDDDNKSYRKRLIDLKREGQDDLIDENSQQPKENVKVTFDFCWQNKDKIEVEVSPEITFNDLVEEFKTQALEKDKYYFKGIDKISFAYNDTLIKTSSSNTSLSSITKSAKNSVTIRVIDGGFDSFGWNVSNINNDINNKNPIPDNENQTPSSNSNWKRILFFVVGIFSLIAALVVFLVNPELMALIIPFAVSGGISLLVAFLWNTIKSCLCRQNPEEISTEPLIEANENDPNKTTVLNDLNNNLSLENNQKNENGQEKTDP